MNRRVALWLLVAANLACLAVVALVPAVLLLGLADVEVPRSAIVGFALVAVPALLNALALLGLQYPGAWPDRSMLRQLALLAAVTIAVICAVSLVQMLIDGRFDLAPFSLVGLLLFTLDALALLYAPTHDRR